MTSNFVVQVVFDFFGEHSNMFSGVQKDLIELIYEKSNIYARRLIRSLNCTCNKDAYDDYKLVIEIYSGINSLKKTNSLDILYELYYDFEYLVYKYIDNVEHVYIENITTSLEFVLDEAIEFYLVSISRANSLVDIFSPVENFFSELFKTTNWLDSLIDVSKDHTSKNNVFVSINKCAFSNYNSKGIMDLLYRKLENSSFKIQSFVLRRKIIQLKRIKNWTNIIDNCGLITGINKIRMAEAENFKTFTCNK